VVSFTRSWKDKEMAEKAARKPRMKKLKVPVEHAVYGPGILQEKRMTDSGPVLVVNFADGTTRSLLAAPEFWKTPAAALAAIPVAKAAKPEPEPEDEPVVEEDDAGELVIQ
jgi:hypothetical protein